MGLGESKRVDLGKYLQALEVFAGREGVKEIKKEFGDYGIAGTITVYTGPERGDGEVMIPFTYEGVKGFLRFNRYGGIYEGLKSRDSVGNVPSDAAELFIGGLFGAKEIPTSSQSEYIKALFLDSPACWLEGSKAYCNTNDLASAKESIDEAKEAEENAKAEANRAETGRQRQDEVADYIRKGNVIWSKAQELIDLVEECDGGPGGIDPDDLKEIRNEYLAKKNTPTNLEEAEQYYEQAKWMLGEMAKNSSGYECIKERGKDIGCSIEMTHTDEPDCKSGETSISGGYETLSCGAIETLKVKSWSSECFRPEPKMTRGKYY